MGHDFGKRCSWWRGGRIGLLFELGDAATVGLAMHGGVDGGAGSACFYAGYGGFAVVSAVYEGARYFACGGADGLKAGLELLFVVRGIGEVLTYDEHRSCIDGGPCKFPQNMQRKFLPCGFAAVG